MTTGAAEDACHFQSVVSPVTGRTLLVNTAKHGVSLAPEITIAAWRSAVQAWNGGARTTPSVRHLVRRLERAKTISTVGRLLQELERGAWSAQESDELWRLLLWLWACDVLALSASFARRLPNGLQAGPEMLGAKWTWLQGVFANDAPAAWDVVALATTALGARELADVMACSVNRKAMPSAETKREAVVAHLADLHRQTIGAAADAWAQRWRVPQRWIKAKRSDPTFAWVSTKAPDCEHWRAAVAGWTATGLERGAIDAGNRLLDYVLARPDVPRDPIACCEPTFRPALSLGAFLATRRAGLHEQARQNNRWHRFFEWLMDREANRDADGRPLRARHWTNPLKRMASGARPTQTHREALPIKLVQALIGLLRDDDFAWPRSLPQERFGGAWCPVRTVALLVALYLPLRHGQIRHLESDERDHERYTSDGWVVLGPAERPCRGVLRRHRENGEEWTVLHVGTSKTYDRSRHDQDPGQPLYWSHADAISAVEMLGRWQREHNPIKGPSSWGDLHSPRTRRTVPGASDRQPPAMFLMRDPLGAHPNEPLSGSRLHVFFLEVMAELERRIEQGETDPLLRACAPLITSRDAHGRPKAGKYDLHCLRVTGLTHLRTHGELPLDFVSRHAAGHATLTMTAHYMKPGAAAIAAKFAEAQQRIIEAADLDFNQKLQDARAADWRPAIEQAPTTHGRGLSNSGAASGLCPSGLGFCANGSTTCCSSGDPCAALITGPAFLPALVHRVRMWEAERRRVMLDYADVESQARRLEREWLERGGEGDEPAALVRLTARSNVLAAAVRRCSAACGAMRQRVSQCLAMVDRRVAGADLNLMVPRPMQQQQQQSLPCVVAGIGVHGVDSIPGVPERLVGVENATQFSMTEAQARTVGEEVAALLLRLSDPSRLGDICQGLLARTGGVTAVAGAPLALPGVVEETSG